MEGLRRLRRRDDRDVVGQRGVERCCETLERRPSLGREARDLTGGVDACVGSPGDGEPVPAGQDGIERIAERALDRPLRGLTGPAAEARAVVP